MNPEKTFKTKTGFCHILPDKIILTPNEVIGNDATVPVKNHLPRPFTIYAGISTGLILAAFSCFKEGQNVPAILYLSIGIFLIWKVTRSFNNSAASIIERKQIKSIAFRNTFIWTSRSYFVVHFENEQKKIKQRQIHLPGTFNNGKDEREKALQIMTSAFGEIKIVT